MSYYQDKTLNCQECNAEFTFSADDQQYHAEKGFTNEPKRCPTCRANRRTSGGGGSYGGGGGGYGGGQREMHPAVCAQCGKDTQVPFLPAATSPSTAATASASSPPPAADATNRKRSQGFAAPASKTGAPRGPC